MKALLLLYLGFLAACLGAYVPGTPGGAWTKQELMIVKAKLYRMFGYGVEAPKAVRLGFHDCLKYADGSGGCDGCLNWHNVGNRVKDFKWVSRSEPNVGVTDNNGLEGIVGKLEKLYTEANYPWNAPDLSESLQASGKSRADLWAYASMVGVEFGIEMNNIACKNRTDPRVKQRTCVHDPNVEECFVRPSRPFVFKSGRVDCTEFKQDAHYQATKQEHHPSPLDNGRKTVDFFKKDFGFTGRETAAIFGAHTFGKPHFSVSLFPYTWTSSGINLFNNDYYKSLTGQNRWFFDDNSCYPVGDAYGNRPKSRWVAHARAATHRGGPIFWIHENLVCPNPKRYDRYNAATKKCIDEAEEGMVCKADARDADGNDLNVNGGCERFRFISGIDEIAMNCEMGLYKDFEVDDGIIHGCPGLEHFNASMTGDRGRIVWSKNGVNNKKGEPLCEKQKLSEPAGSTPLYQVMEEYANDQTTWINDYIQAHEKMVSNGYASGSLSASPDHFTNVVCPMPLIKGHDHTYCYEETAPSGPVFMISNRMPENDGRVIVQRGQTLYMEEQSGDQAQFWQQAGDNIINVVTKEPLRVFGSTFWAIETTTNNDFIIRNTVTNKVMDSWPCRNGGAMTIYKKHGGANQIFYPIIHT